MGTVHSREGGIEMEYWVLPLHRTVEISMVVFIFSAFALASENIVVGRRINLPGIFLSMDLHLTDLFGRLDHWFVPELILHPTKSFGSAKSSLIHCTIFWFKIDIID